MRKQNTKALEEMCYTPTLTKSLIQRGRVLATENKQTVSQMRRAVVFSSYAGSLYHKTKPILLDECKKYKVPVDPKWFIPKIKDSLIQGYALYIDQLKERTTAFLSPPRPQVAIHDKPDTNKSLTQQIALKRRRCKERSKKKRKLLLSLDE